MKTVRTQIVSRCLAVASFLACVATLAHAQLPDLAISRNATNVTLTWGTNHPDFILENSGTLTGSWTNVAEATNGTATLPMVSSNQFFRLKETVSLTYILNEGFLLQSRGKKVLIDGIFEKFVWEDYYGVPSSEVLHQQTNALPPFDNINALLVSHIHTDHLEPRYTFQHLTNDPNAMLIGPPSVYNTIQSANGSNFWMVTNQIVQAVPTNGSSTNVVIGDMTFKVVGLRSDDPVQNVGFLFTLGGLRFLHVGDTTSTNLFDYQPMVGEEIDVAMINCILFTRPQGVQEVMNLLKPRTMLVMHVPPTMIEDIRNLINGLTNIPPFYMMGTNAMTTYRFPAR